MALNFQSDLDFLRFRWRPEDSVSDDLRQSIEAYYSEVMPVKLEHEPFFFKQFICKFPEFLHIFDYDSVDDDGVLNRCWRQLSNYQHYETGVFGIDSVFFIYDSFDTRKGVTVNIPSRGLWIIKDWFGFDTFKDFLSSIRDRGAHFTRIDICFDDYDYRESGHFRAWDFCKLQHDGALVTSCRRNPHYNFNDCYDIVYQECGERSNDHVGATFQLGTRQSDRLLRVYDKFIESRHKANRLHDESVFKDCVRYEFEIHAAYADNFVNALLFSPTSLQFKDFVNGWFRFVNIYDHKEDYSNKSMLEELPEWKAFINLEFSEELLVQVASPEVVDIWVRSRSEPTLESRVKFFDYTCEEIFYRKLLFLDDPFDYLHKCLERIRAGDVSDKFKNDVISHTHVDYNSSIRMLKKELILY